MLLDEFKFLKSIFVKIYLKSRKDSFLLVARSGTSFIRLSKTGSLEPNPPRGEPPSRGLGGTLSIQRGSEVTKSSQHFLLERE